MLIKKCIINLLKPCYIEKHAESLMRRKNWQIKTKYKTDFTNFPKFNF